MKLYIEHHGQLFFVIDDLEEYDLEKPIARIAIMNELQSRVAAVKKETGE